jgi:hypothetical protein
MVVIQHDSIVRSLGPSTSVYRLEIYRHMQLILLIIILVDWEARSGAVG